MGESWSFGDMFSNGMSSLGDFGKGLLGGSSGQDAWTGVGADKSSLTMGNNFAGATQTWKDGKYIGDASKITGEDYAKQFDMYGAQDMDMSKAMPYVGMGMQYMQNNKMMKAQEKENDKKWTEYAKLQAIAKKDREGRQGLLTALA